MSPLSGSTMSRAGVLAFSFLMACAPAREPAAPELGVSREPLARGRLSSARVQSTLTALPDGTFLLAGGFAAIPGPLPPSAPSGPPTPVQTADLYDPERGQVIWSGTMQRARSGHTATLLPDGRVLLTGGGNPYAELFDPVTRTFTATAGTMNDSRTGHSATLLPDGRVLVVGGGATDATTCQYFTPSTGLFTTAPPTVVARTWHSAVFNTLVNPPVLVVVGGLGATSTGDDFRTTEVFDPISESWAKKPKMGTAGSGANASAAMLLLDGGILIAGTATSDLYNANTTETQEYVFNGTGWTSLGYCGGNFGFPGLVLPDGNAYTLGAYGGGTGCNFITTQASDPHLRRRGIGACVDLGAPQLDLVRRDGNAALTPNGSVLLAGGLQFYACGYNIYDSLSVVRWGSLVRTALPPLTGAGRLDAVVTPLWTGGALLTGGTTADSASATVIDAAGATGASVPLSSVRVRHTATLLSSGQVLVAGGLDDAGVPLATAELVNPEDGGVVSMPLLSARAWHTAALLEDGRVLLAGGVGLDGGVTASTELVDPSALSSLDGPVLNQRRANHATARLPTGEVVVAGGQIGSSVLVSAERLTADAGWVRLGNLSTARTELTLSEVSGQLLAIGGSSTSTSPTATPLASTEWLQADAGWTAGAPLAGARYGHTATVLPSGQLLVAAGVAAGSPLSTTEVLEPQVGTFTAGPALSGPRSRHGAVPTAAGAMFVGGELVATSVDRVSDNAVISPSLRPTLQAPTAAVAQGGTLSLTGTGFTGQGDNGGGSFRGSATNLPTFFVCRADGEGRRFLRTTSWSATSAAVALPATLGTGSYWLRVSVGGVMSAPVRLRVGLADGQSCPGPASCVSGYCVGGVCCADATCGVDAGTGGGGGATGGGGGATGGGGGATGGGGGATGGGGGVTGGGGGATGGGAATGGGTATGGGATGGGEAAGGGTATGGGEATGGGGATTDLYGCSCGPGQRSGSPLLVVFVLGLVVLSRRRAGAGALLLLVVLPLSAQAQPKKESVAFLELRVSGDVKKELGDVLLDQLVATLDARGMHKVTSPKDLQTVLGFERQKALLGCSDAACAVELASALGVDRVVSGAVAKVGSSFVVNLTLLNPTTGNADRRFHVRARDATDEALLDLVGPAIDALFPQTAKGGASPTVVDSAEPAAGGSLKRVELAVRGQLSPLLAAGLHGAIAPHAAVRLTDWLALGAGAVLAPQSFGAFFRAKVTPWNANGAWHPVLGLEVPVLFPTSGVAVAVGGFVGVEFTPLPWLLLGLEVPLQYAVVAPADQGSRFFIFGALSAGVRL